MSADNRVSHADHPKTVPAKFGLKPGMSSLVINRPEDYDQIMSSWQFQPAKAHEQLDFIHLFVTTARQLSQLAILKSQLQPNGMIWISWPKKSSGVKTEVTEDGIRNLALELGLVDIKVCAVSSIWSGLKLVIPRAQRYNANHKH